MSLTAADIMTTNVKTVRPNASVAEVARLLSDNEISAVPVCDAHGQVLGILSEGDLLRPEYGRAELGEQAARLHAVEPHAASRVHG